MLIIKIKIKYLKRSLRNIKEFQANLGHMLQSLISLGLNPIFYLGH